MFDTSASSSGRQFGIVDLDSADFNLASIHDQVVSGNGRFELTRNGQVCVLISKVELQGLESALEILADTESVRGMRDQIATVAQLASQSDSSPSKRFRAL